jgi:hypothetical protein
MKTLELIPIYSEIVDNLGDHAKVYYMDDLKHEIRFYGTNGKLFWTEVYENTPIEEVEQLAIDWAKGKRELT